MAETEQTITFTEYRVRTEWEIIASIAWDTESIKRCDKEMLDWTGLKVGDIVFFETAEVTKVIRTRREWGRGFNGELVPRVISRAETVTESKRFKLVRRKDGLHWKELDQ